MIDINFGEEIEVNEEPQNEGEAPNENNENQEQANESGNEESDNQENEEDSNLIEVNEEEEENNDEDDGNNSDSDDSDSSNQDESEGQDENQGGDDEEFLDVYANELVENGIYRDFDMEAYSKLETPEEKAQALIDQNLKERDADIQAWIDKFPDRLKTIISGYKDDVPLEEIIGIAEEQFTYDSIDDEVLASDESKQESIYKESLMKLKGFSEAKANKMVQRSKDAEELYEDSKDALDELKENVEKQKQAKIEESKNAKELAKKQHKETLDTLRSSIDGTKEIVPGVELDKKTKDRLFDSMTRVVAYDSNNKPLTKIGAVRAKDPVKFELIMHYLEDIGVFEGDFSKITKPTESRTKSKLASRISSGSSRGGGRSLSRNKKQEQSKNDMIDSMKMFMR